jgi:hypothetical protein
MLQTAHWQLIYSMFTRASVIRQNILKDLVISFEYPNNADGLLWNALSTGFCFFVLQHLYLNLNWENLFD